MPYVVYWPWSKPTEQPRDGKSLPKWYLVYEDAETIREIRAYAFKDDAYEGLDLLNQGKTEEYVISFMHGKPGPGEVVKFEQPRKRKPILGEWRLI